MVIKHYKCTWCNEEFDRNAEYIQGEKVAGTKSKGKKGSLSNQIRCPKCHNFIPTWDVYYVDGKKIKVRGG